MKDFDWKILSTLYKTKNITTVSKLLYTGQPNVSKRIQAIEKEFGFLIVNRTAKGIVFTKRGEVLAKYAVEIDALIQKAVEEVQHKNAESLYTIRIIAPNSFASLELPSLLEAYQKNHPNVSFRVSSCLSDDIASFIKSDETDIAFSHMDSATAAFSCCLHQEPLFIYSKRSVDLDHLPEYAQIDYTRSEGTRYKINKWWSTHYTVPQKVAFTMSNIDACFESVSKGLGYAFLFGDRYPKKDQSLISIPILDETGVPVSRSTWLLASRAGFDKQIVQDFLRFVKNESNHRHQTASLRV